MTDHHASCSCGQLRLVAHGEPVRVSMCHCYACQRRTGSTYGAQARFPAGNVEITGTSTEYVRVGESGNGCHFHFCPTCGATVFYRLDDEATCAVPVGAFADNTFPPPRFSVWEERMHPWVGVPEGAERRA
jgi:hypothetical protein